jgi:predicted RNA binding protein YcfA (HicA-like mRNA interferase family)
MPKIPAITGEATIKALEKVGFQSVRQKDSHVRLKHQDGRVVSVPVHSGKTLGKGLLRKILRDAELTLEEFIGLLG